MRPLTVLLLVLALVLGTSTARAQERSDEKRPPAGPENDFVKQMVQMLKDELDLSADQVERVTETLRDGMKLAMKKMLSRMGDDNPPSPEERRKDEAEVRESIVGRIREVLDEGQKREFETLVKEFDQRAGRWERGRGVPGGDASVWFEGELPTRERLLVKSENVLLLSEDEKAVILPKIDAVVVARSRLREVRRERRKDLSRAVNRGARQDEVKERLHDLRAKGEQFEADLRKAEDELRELLSIDQEARLVAIGVLD